MHSSVFISATWCLTCKLATLHPSHSLSKHFWSCVRRQTAICMSPPLPISHNVSKMPLITASSVDCQHSHLLYYTEPYLKQLQMTPQQTSRTLHTEIQSCTTWLISNTWHMYVEFYHSWSTGRACMASSPMPSHTPPKFLLSQTKWLPYKSYKMHASSAFLSWYKSHTTNHLAITLDSKRGRWFRPSFPSWHTLMSILPLQLPQALLSRSCAPCTPACQDWLAHSSPCGFQKLWRTDLAEKCKIQECL